MFGKKRKAAAVLMSMVAMLSAAAGTIPQLSPIKADAASRIVAFPGAVGGGKYATGGRYGQVYHVTNLNDSGEGSFRDAVSRSNRIVVFDVSGTIELKSAVSCVSNVTVAGQTAPGGSGITLKNYKMAFGGDNIICRYISSRPGPYNATSSGNDAWGGSKGSDCIVDHCSIGWASDEQWGLYSNNSNYTVQYTVIGPANSWGGHDKGIHGFGIMMGNSSLSFDHNLIIHNVSRNFRGKVPETGVADFTNNVIYDWGYQTAYGTIGHVNYVNNTLKAGNSTTGGYNWINVDSTTSPQNFKVYCTGNRMINKDGSINPITSNNWNGITVKDGIGITKNDLSTSYPFTIGLDGENLSSYVNCESAEASYEHVISFAGNGISPDKRTATDRQCAEETKNGTGQCSGTAAYDSSVSDLNKYSIKCGVTYSYPSAVLKKEITDEDNDGMDDNWELARGLDPQDPTDTSGDYCGKGYTNIEYYINDLTVNSFPEGVVTLSPESDAPPQPSTPAVSALEKIQADSFSDKKGVFVEEYSSGNNVAGIGNGDWMMYRKINFGGGVNSFSGYMSGDPCTLELYLDNMNGSPAAEIEFPGAQSFKSYTLFESNIPKISGIHNLYIKFKGDDDSLSNMKYFVFGEDRIPLNGKLFTDVQVASDAYPDSWSVGTNAQVGSKFFGDRDFTFAQLQSNLAGAEILMTACDAKGATGDTATFTAGADMSLYVGLDSRVKNVPDWFSDYVLMRSLCTSDNDVSFMIYKKDIKAGEKVTLGGNGQSSNCVNFIVLGVTDVTAATEVEGDINSDNYANVGDLVVLKDYLLGEKNMTAEQCERADLIKDGVIDVFDLIKLRKIILSK